MCNHVTLTSPLHAAPILDPRRLRQLAELRDSLRQLARQALDWDEAVTLLELADQVEHLIDSGCSLPVERTDP